MTIHQLLNYKKSYNQDGQLEYTDPSNKNNKFDIIIFDEVSMVTKQVITDILN